MLKVGIIGAGQTGRGFIPRLLAGQAEFTFADKNAELVEKLNAAQGYEVRFFGGKRESVHIKDYRAYTLENAADALKDCDLIFISVRAENTPEAGKWLKENVGLKPLVCCENAPRPAALVESAGLQAASGAIFCTTVKTDTMDIESEDFPALYVSAENLPDALRNLDGFRSVDDFDLLMQRKLYTYNAASGIIAYLGAKKGYEDYAAAANDPEIDGKLDLFYGEINRAICASYGVEEQAQDEFAKLSKTKFQNRAIVDNVARNAASPMRKLGANERIMEPMRLIEKNGGDASVLYETAAAALRYAGAATLEDAQKLLMEAAGVAPDEKRALEILKAFNI